MPPAQHLDGSRSGGTDPADLNLRILQSLVRYVEEQFGHVAVEGVARAAEVRAEELDGRNRWVSHERFENALAEARKLFEDDDRFRDACGYRLADGYGPMRWLFWATSPDVVFDRAFRSFPTISAISVTEVVERHRSFVRTVYRSDKPESRLMCLSRQGQAVQLPRLWGLPAADLEERSCLAWGHDTCEYLIRFHPPTRWLPAAGAGAVLGALGFGATSLGWAGWPFVVAMVVLGVVAGYCYELVRIAADRRRRAEELQTALREAAEEENEARRELLAMQQRERQWSQVLERELAERTDIAEQTTRRLQHLQDERVVALRGISHDLRNPLFVIMAFVELLERRSEALGPEIREMIADQQQAVANLQKLLDELIRTATPEQSSRLPREPQSVQSDELTETLRRRLRALCFGRDIRVTVFSTREAPESIRIDWLAFNRVVDNLLTNAAKYTEGGSIIVEVGGTPGYLTLKISDTGCGIADEDIAQVFQPRGERERRASMDSYGLGLSVVVELMARLGGRLEVMSKVDLGTTFWAHFPTEPAEPEKPAPADLDNVVTIRKAR